MTSAKTSAPVTAHAAARAWQDRRMSTSSKTKPGIALSELIKTVRLELQKAEKAGGDEQLRFRVDDVELEVSVEIQHAEALDGGFKLYVFEAGANQSDQTTHAHRIKINFKPLGPEGKDVLITGAGVEPSKAAGDVLMGGG